MKPRPARRQHFYIAPSRLLRTRLLPFRSPGVASPGPGAEWGVRREEGEIGRASEPRGWPRSWTDRVKRVLLPAGPGRAPAGGHEGARAPRAKLNNLQPLQALRARRRQFQRGLWAAQGLTWHRPDKRNTSPVGEGLVQGCLGRGLRSLANNSPCPAQGLN